MNDLTKPNDTLLSFEEAARFLDTSKSTLYRLLNAGDVKGVRVGRQWRFRRHDLTAYVERGPVAVATDAASRADAAAETAWLEDEARAYGAQVEGDEDGIEGLVERILLLAVAAKASDLHLEPTDASFRLRFRIDGVLHEIRQMPLSLHEPTLARFKELSGMSVAERRLPQDGRAEVAIEGEPVDLRMNVMPTLLGENVVVRLFRRDAALLGLDRLGDGPGEFEGLRPRLGRAGLVLVAGPAASGRTTLLYSCLQEIDAVAKKVLTVEDPVERRLPDVAQVQVNRRLGLTAAAALHACMRQDPDVALCGAATDLETVEAILNAALTGHLALAGLPAEDAASAVRRLADLGLESYRIASGLSAVVATRLVRRLDPETRVVADDEETLSLLARLGPLSKRGGYTIPNDAVFYAAPKEGRPGAGYAGRMGLYEILLCDPKLVRQILGAESHEAARALAVASGTRTFLGDGMRKAVLGLTSIEEVLRATETRL